MNTSKNSPSDDLNSNDNVYVRDWLSRNESAIAALLKRRPEVRASWLDQLLRQGLATISQAESTESSVHYTYQDLMDLFRTLAVQLKLRKDIKDYHLNTFTPLVKVLSDKSSEVLPGSYSGTRKHLEFKLGVFKEIERRFPVITDDRGFAIDTGYGHDVSRLLSLTGFVPREIGVRPLSNLHQRVEHGLSNNIPDDYLSMVDDFLLLMYGIVEAKSIRLESKSQSGLPMRFYGRGYKTLGFINAVINLDDIIKNSSDIDYLLEKYDILYAFLQGSRQSPDAGGKKRYITSVADNAAGLAGNTLQDNHPDLPHIPKALSKFFATMRYRFVWGGNSISNSIVNTIGTSARHTYGMNYSFTFKHKGRDDLLIKLRQFYGKLPTQDVHKSECDLVVIDVTNFDLDYPKDILLKYVNFFKDSGIADFFFRTAFAPSVQGTLDKSSTSEEPIINGDLFNFNPMDYVNSGLPSGWSWVSDAGKIMALNIYYCLVKAKLLGNHSIQQLDGFLRGELNYGCFNLGDDNVILCPSGKFDDVLESLKKYSVWLVDLEPGARFIGYPIFFDSFGNLKITHDPASYVTNWLTPERAIGGKFSKYWAFGLQQRERVYADAPIIHEFRKIILSKWKEVYDTDLNSIIDHHAREQKSLLEANANDKDDIVSVLYAKLESAPDITLATAILADVQRDSSTLQWKWESEDILQAFGIRLEDIENRPHVKYTEKVLEHSGYSILLKRSVKEDYYGNLYIHSNLVTRHDAQEVIELVKTGIDMSKFEDFVPLER